MKKIICYFSFAAIACAQLPKPSGGTGGTALPTKAEVYQLTTQ